MSNASPTLRRVSRFHLALVAALLAFSALVTTLFAARVPLRDQWRILGTYLQHPGIEGLWAPQNGHITFFPGLLYRADLHWFAADGTLLLWVMHLCNLGVALLLAGTALRAPGGKLLRPMAAAFAVFCLYWLGNTLHLTWGQGVAHHLMVFTLLLALMAAQRAGRAQRPGPWLALACGLALVASYSFGNGLLAWPLLIGVGWLAGVPRRALLRLALVAGLAVAVYLLSVPGHGAQPWVRATWRHFLDLLVIFLGAPVAHALDFLVPLTTPATVGVARWSGIAMLAAGVAAALVAWRRRVTAPGAIRAFAVLALVVGTALLVAWTRVEQFGPAVGASQRYVVWGALYLAALAALLPHLLDGDSATAATALLVATLFMVPTHLKMGLGTARAAHGAAETALALGTVVHDDRMVLAYLADSGRYDIVYNVSLALRKRALGPFDDPLMRLAGTPFPRHFKLVGVDRCQGALERIDPVEGTQPRGWRVSGWAWDVAARRPPAFVVFINPAGEIRGVARFSRSGGGRAEEGAGVRLARLLSPELPGLLGVGNGWFGYVHPTRRLLPLAVLADGSSACPLPVTVGGKS
ncbi:MAG: hypothetical protein HZA24_09135 [Nitrospirae bacterium]|nr:hypothetical protein [Nitrospirota bacterium]